MSSKNILGGGHLLETSSSGARKLWGKSRIYSTFGVAASLAVVGLFTALLFPEIPASVSAEEVTTIANLNVDSVVAITVPSEVTMAINPTSGGAFQQTTADLAISTNNSTGYDLYLSAADGDNVLRNENPSVQNTINPTADGVTSTTMSNNTWGYNLSGGSSTQTPDTYNAVPKDGTTALDSTTAPSTTNYNLTFGAKVDTSIASGTYSSEVIISAVAKPAYVPTISAMTNMQDVTAEICAASADGETATLTDTRDNNTYTVAKINGDCWMTQNLRLSGGRTLTPADSNVTSNWEFPNNSLRSGGTNYIGDSYTEAGFVISDNPLYATEYGGYYNYCAASAGSVCKQTEMDATQSICPAGWTLPTLDQFSSITSYTSAFSPVYSGNYSSGSLYGTSSRGYGLWWSATADDNDFQYFLGYSNSGSLYTSGLYKYYGYSVRCVRSS